MPAGGFGIELRLALAGELIDPYAAAGFRFGSPGGGNMTVDFEAMEGGVDRAFFDAKHFVGDFVDGKHEGVAMQAWALAQNFEEKKVEGALERVGFRHTQESDYSVL